MSAGLATVANPFEEALPAASSAIGGAVESESSRAIAEVQGAILLAKKFPRDQVRAMDRILSACCRQSLAESAVYCYSRGGTDVTGPSIRLAEALAQSWGNLQYGIRELSQGGGKSTVEAFAWDMETNTRQTKVFEVPHVRDTRSGRKILTDARDIYETVANQGARRLRACILGVIPGDVVDAAVAQCEETLKTKADVTPEGIRKLVEGFQEIGVSAEALAAKLGHNLEAIQAAEVVRLRKIFRAIRDGFTTAAAEFPAVAEETAKASPAATAAQAAASKAAKAAKEKASRKAPETVLPDPVVEPEQLAKSIEEAPVLGSMFDELKAHIASTRGVRSLMKIQLGIATHEEAAAITPEQAAELVELCRQKIDEEKRSAELHEAYEKDPITGGK